MAPINYLHKSVSLAATNYDDFVSERAWELVLKVYASILFTCFCSFGGAGFQLWYDFGGLNTLLSFGLCIWWIWISDHIICRFVILCVASFLFGLTFGPILSMFYEKEQSCIADFLMSGVVVFADHLISLCWHRRNAVYHVNNLATMMLIIFWFVLSCNEIGLHMNTGYVLALPLLWYILGRRCTDLEQMRRLWMPMNLQWISVLSACYGYPLHRLLCIFFFVMCILKNLRMHTQETIFLAAGCAAEEGFIVTRNITFYSEFVGRTVYFFIDTGRTIFVQLLDSVDKLLFGPM